jgi:lysozyme family protein
MMAITYDDVAPLYKKNYWDKAKCDELPSGLDWAVFDWGVNSGMARPVKAMQKSIKTTVDGGVGPMTLAAVNAADIEKTIKSINTQRQKFYESLKTFETFGKGWTRRNKETLEQALKMLE